MTSCTSNLRNIEIGVLNYTNQKLILLNIIKVSPDKLEFIDKEDDVK